MKEPVVEMAFNDSGVRDTAGVLKISINTVIWMLKNHLTQGTSSPVAHGDIALSCKHEVKLSNIGMAATQRMVGYTFGREQIKPGKNCLRY